VGGAAVVVAVVAVVGAPSHVLAALDDCLDSTKGTRIGGGGTRTGGGSMEVLSRLPIARPGGGAGPRDGCAEARMGSSAVVPVPMPCCCSCSCCAGVARRGVLAIDGVAKGCSRLSVSSVGPSLAPPPPLSHAPPLPVSFASPQLVSLAPPSPVSHALPQPLPHAVPSPASAHPSSSSESDEEPASPPSRSSSPSPAASPSRSHEPSPRPPSGQHAWPVARMARATRAYA
jgi:hypothetical protein